MATLSVSATTLKPLGDRVLVKVLEQEDKTSGGILLPDTAREKPQLGEVTAVGPGRKTEEGNVVPTEVKVGDKVLYAKYAGTEIKIASSDYLLLTEKDILAIAE